jgi:hypothetical protein
MKTVGSSVNFNSISKPETEIVKAGVILKDKLNTVESKDFVSNKSDKVEYNSLATSKTEINNAGSPKITSEACNVKGGFIARLKLKIKNYYRRILVGVKKGLSTPTLPPKTQNLIGNPLISIIKALWSISMIICVTNQLAEFNTFLQITILIIFIFNILFSSYITIIRARNIRKVIKDGAYDVRN